MGDIFDPNSPWTTEPQLANSPKSHRWSAGKCFRQKSRALEGLQFFNFLVNGRTDEPKVPLRVYCGAIPATEWRWVNFLGCWESNRGIQYPNIGWLASSKFSADLLHLKVQSLMRFLGYTKSRIKQQTSFHQQVNVTESANYMGYRPLLMAIYQENIFYF